MSRRAIPYPFKFENERLQTRIIFVRGPVFHFSNSQTYSFPHPPQASGRSSIRPSNDEGAGAPSGATSSSPRLLRDASPFGAPYAAGFSGCADLMAISDPGAATSGRSGTRTAASAKRSLYRLAAKAFPRPPDARPASLRRRVLLPADGYLGPPGTAIAEPQQQAPPPPHLQERLRKTPLHERRAGI